MFFEKPNAEQKFVLNKISIRFSDFIGDRFLESMQREERALEIFGHTLHVMKDNTSPTHGGFQDWQDAYKSGEKNAFKINCLCAD